MEQSISYSETQLLSYKIVICIRDNRYRTSLTLSLLKVVPTRTKTQELRSTIVRLDLQMIWLRATIRSKRIWDDRGKSIHARFSCNHTWMVLLNRLVGESGMEILHWVRCTMQSITIPDPVQVPRIGWFGQVTTWSTQPMRIILRFRISYLVMSGWFRVVCLIWPVYFRNFLYLIILLY